MSHPDPLFDPDNSYEDDDMNYHDDTIDPNYDDYEDFYDDSYDDDMDGDAESAFGSCGWGVDEYYNDTPMYDDYYGGE
jgi:hypothetical protein